MNEREGLWVFALSKVINNRFFQGCQNHISPLFSSSSYKHKLPIQGGSEQLSRRQRRKLLPTAGTRSGRSSQQGVSPWRCLCDYTKPSLGHFLGVLIMLMQNKSKITGASSQRIGVQFNPTLTRSWHQLCCPTPSFLLKIVQLCSVKSATIGNFFFKFTDCSSFQIVLWAPF